MLASLTSFAFGNALFLSASVLATDAQQTPLDKVDGCNKAWDGAQYYANFTISINDNPRNFSIYVPPNYSDDYPNTPIARRPLIVDFHGAGGTSAKQFNNSMYWAHPEGQKYLVVYPQGIDNDWYGPKYADPASADDMIFVGELLAHMSENYCIDEMRIFASGKSAGGGFVDTIARSTTGENFRAFAMAAPALYTDGVSVCDNIDPGCQTPRLSRNILQAHGLDDSVIKYAGCCHCTRKHGDTYYKDVSLPSISQWVWTWAQRNCYNTSISIPPSHTVGHVIYNETGYGVVSHFRVHDLGHCWPQSDRTIDNSDYQNSKLGCNSYDLDFTDEVISFFEKAVPMGDDGIDSSSNGDRDGDAAKIEL